MQPLSKVKEKTVRQIFRKLRIKQMWDQEWLKTGPSDFLKFLALNVIHPIKPTEEMLSWVVR